MRLWEHREFEKALRAAETHFAALGGAGSASARSRRGISATVLEKDYFVTECLRITRVELGDGAIFKGGTSLSKGWKLIDRFSEDVDIFIDPLAFTPPLRARSAIARVRRIATVFERQFSVERETIVTGRITGPGRRERFAYASALSAASGVDARINPAINPVIDPAINPRVEPAVAPTVILEAGTSSGREPTVTREIRSLLAEYLAETHQSLGAVDEDSFPIRVLHFRRTFVEKLFAVHQAVHRTLTEGRGIGLAGRHYYDLAMLAPLPEIMTMFESGEYRRIVADCGEVGRAAFAANFVAPVGQRFHDSPALFPSARLSAELAREYERQCRVLCFGEYPPWPEVMRRFEALRVWL